jgi:hypothetical protein
LNEAAEVAVSTFSLCSAVTVLAPLFGNDFKIRDEQQIENVHPIVGLEHDGCPPTRGEGYELAMMDGYMASVRKVNRELLKWFRVEDFPQSLAGHFQFSQ